MPTSPNVKVNSGVTLVTTAETVLTTTVARQVNAPSSIGQYISGVINVTAGAGTTAFVVRVRAGSDLTGAVIGGPETVAATASVNANVAYAQMDFVNNAQVQYTVTIQQTGATGNGTVNFVSLSEQTANTAGA